MIAAVALNVPVRVVALHEDGSVELGAIATDLDSLQQAIAEHYNGRLSASQDPHALCASCDYALFPDVDVSSGDAQAA
jgi:hypothetical protein